MEIIDYLIAPYASYDLTQILLELTGTLFGLLSVYFSIKKNIWVYPTGIISTITYVYIHYHFGLWGEMIINAYFTSMSVYGWIIWAKSSEDNVHVEVSRAKKEDWIKCILLFIISIIFITFVYYYKPYINNGFSNTGIILEFSHLDWSNYVDIFTTSIFFVGMWLMAKKKVENWIFWIIGDLLCVPMMIYKGLGITAIQYLIFTIMAIIGFINWNRMTKNSQKLKL